MLVLVLHPLPFVIVYRILAVPVVMPLTTPVVDTVAMVGAELLQIPPVIASVKVVVLPTQTDLLPPMGTGVAGIGFTVTEVPIELEHPRPSVIVYKMDAVPVVRLDTTPVDETVATNGVRLLHTPTAMASVKVVVLPRQTDLLPEIGSGTLGAGLIRMDALPVMVFDTNVVASVPVAVYVPATG